MAQRYVGIDFGACNIKVASYTNKGKKNIIKLNKAVGEGAETPNVIYYKDANAYDIGKVALRTAKLGNRKNLIAYIKRKLELAHWSTYIDSLGRNITAAEVAADIFSWLQKTISDNISQEQVRAVITMPVCFSEVQKRRIYEAAVAAHIDVEAVITEPFAAAFSLEGLLDEEGEQVVLVFDFGGSTLDLSLLRVESDGDGEACITELAARGMHYGGLDIDRDIYERCFKPKYEAEVREIIAADDTEGTAEQELLEIVRTLKEDIFESEEDEAEYPAAFRQIQKHYTFTLTRDEVYAVLSDVHIKDRIVQCLDELFDSTDEATKDDVTRAQPFGGTSKIPYFREILSEYVGDDVFDSENYDIDDAYVDIAAGAAYYFYLKHEESDVEIHNIIPFYIGLDEQSKFIKYINRNERYGFETFYNPLRIADLEKSNYAVSVYQAFRDISDVPIDDEDVIFMGKINLDKALYTAKDAILFKMKMAEDGELHMRFFERQEKENDWEIVLIEDKIVPIGG